MGASRGAEKNNYWS